MYGCSSISLNAQILMLTLKFACKFWRVMYAYSEDINLRSALLFAAKIYYGHNTNDYPGLVGGLVDFSAYGKRCKTPLQRVLIGEPVTTSRDAIGQRSIMT
jgi:hypothetical protein